MATSRIVIAESTNVSASQLAELFRQIKIGSIAGKHLQSFIEHKNPFKLVFAGEVTIAVTNAAAASRPFFNNNESNLISTNPGTLMFLSGNADPVQPLTLGYLDLDHETPQTEIEDNFELDQNAMKPWHLEQIIQQQLSGEQQYLIADPHCVHVFFIYGMPVLVGRLATIWDVCVDRDQRTPRTFLKGWRVFVPKKA